MTTNDATNASVAERPTPAVLVQAAMAARQGDGDAEEKRLDHAHGDIPHADIRIFRVLPVIMGFNAEEPVADERPP